MPLSLALLGIAPDWAAKRGGRQTNHRSFERARETDETVKVDCRGRVRRRELAMVIKMVGGTNPPPRRILFRQLLHPGSVQKVVDMPDEEAGDLKGWNRHGGEDCSRHDERDQVCQHVLGLRDGRGGYRANVLVELRSVGAATDSCECAMQSLVPRSLGRRVSGARTLWWNR